MDLSNLSSNLPPTKPLDQTSKEELNAELTTEFKNAARSVAALYNASIQGRNGGGDLKVDFANAARSVATLYRLAHSSNEVVHNVGYLACLDDMLDLIKRDEDIEDWALAKRAEVTNMYNSNNIGAVAASVQTTIEDDDPHKQLGQDFGLPEAYEFSMTLGTIPPQHFRPSIPPLSVSHSTKQRNNFKQFKRPDNYYKMMMRQRLLLKIPLDEVLSASEEGESDQDPSDETDVLKIKRKLAGKELPKRRKKAHTE